MQNEQKTEVGTRVLSMFLDYTVMIIVAMIFFIPKMLSDTSMSLDVTHHQKSQEILGLSAYLGLIGLALFFCKDSIGGQSIIKRLLKLQIIEKRSGKVASPIRCLVRNLFFVIWPVELIMTIVNPSRRLGDMVAGTLVVPFNKGREKGGLSIAKIGIAFLLAYGSLVLAMIHFQGEMRMIDEQVAVKYVESSINEEATMKAEEFFADSLGDSFTPDVLVYDRIEGEPDLKYVSVIIMMKENLLEEGPVFMELHKKFARLLLNMFPKRTFVGKIQYVYKEETRMTSQIIWFDWRRVEQIGN